jgi:hypothetical protein
VFFIQWLLDIGLHGLSNQIPLFTFLQTMITVPNMIASRHTCEAKVNNDNWANMIASRHNDCI